MKLTYKLINKRKLFEKIICIGVLFSLYTNSATVNMAQQGNYQFNNVGGVVAQKWNKGQGAANILTAATLRSHLLAILGGMKDGAYTLAAAPGITLQQARNSACVREIARMLLAQIPAAAGGAGPHNVEGNDNPAYTIAAKIGGNNCDDIFLACDALKEHMLIHGHLGYFPFMKNNENLSRVETFIARGIFNIPFNIASRITNDQHRLAQNIFSQRQLTSLQTHNGGAFPHGYNITNDVIHLSPNILADTELPHMFEIDPERRGWPYYPNLNSVANGLINNLLSGNYVANVIMGAVNRNRFTIDVTYNFPNAIPGVTQTSDIGYNLDGIPTNTVKIVVQVLNGIISIITMYPI